MSSSSHRPISNDQHLKGFPNTKWDQIKKTLNSNATLWAVVENVINTKINQIGNKRRSEITAKEVPNYEQYQAHLNGQEFALIELLKMIQKKD